MIVCDFVVFFFKQKTAYEMRISDWSSDVCSSDLHDGSSQEAGSAGVVGLALRGGRLERRLPAAMRVHGHRPRVSGQVAAHALRIGDQIGRASCRERVCQYV